LEQVAEASDAGFSIIVQKVLSVVLNIITLPGVEETRKHILFQFLNSLIKRSLSGHRSGLEQLGPYITKLDDLYSLHLIDKSSIIRTDSVTGSALLLRYSLATQNQDSNGSPSTVEQARLKLLNLTQTLLKDQDHSVRMQCLASLVQINNNVDNNALILDVTIPKLLNQLKDWKAANQPSEGQSLQLILHTLSSLAAQPKLFQTIILQLLLLGSLQEVAKDNLPFIRAIYRGLSNTVGTNITLHQNNIGVCLEFTDSLLSSLIQRSSQTEDTLDEEVFLDILDILKRIVQSADTSVQEGFLKKMSSVFIEGNCSTIAPNIPSFQPFQSASPSQNQLQLIFMNIIFCVKRNVPIPSFSTVIDQLLKSSSDLNAKISLAASQSLACLINKTPVGPALESTTSSILEKLWGKIDEDNAQFDRPLQTLLWVTKALVMRDHTSGYTSIRRLCDNLKSASLGSNIAQGLGILFDDKDGVLEKEYDAQIKALYKQKVFTQVLPLILRGVDEALPEVKSNYFVALSNFLNHLPKAVLLSELPKITPLLIQTLSAGEATLRFSTLQTISLILRELPSLIETHLQVLVPVLLDIGINDTHMDTRVAALECLSNLAEQSSSLPQLFPFKIQVLKTLQNALDDKKRLVRQKAANTRNLFFGLKTTGK